MRGRGALVGIAVLCLMVAASGCSTRRWQAEFATPEDPSALDSTSPFLKVHTKDGQVYVLREWTLRPREEVVTGLGIRYTALRTSMGVRQHTIAFGDVALLETNRPRSVFNGGMAVLGVVSAASLAGTAACLSIPKACFGSCPTFYADPGDGSGESLQAEGFSASIARSLEETDVDALRAAEVDGRVHVTMRNEALETHMVRLVRLLFAPRPPDREVMRAGDRFFVVGELQPPLRCTVDGADCLGEVTARDDMELAPRVDPTDLAARHHVELELPPSAGRVALVLEARNSFVTTFLLYQVLSWMGSRAGEWMVALDEGLPEMGAAGYAHNDRLGDLRVLVGEDGEWREAGVHDEVGPITGDSVIVPLPEGTSTDDLTVRLDMAKGYWRIDRIAVVTLHDEVEPIAVDPTSVVHRGEADARALAALLDDEDQLVTYPGDTYVLSFDAPEGDHEVFLESTGWYYEWLREEWLREEDPARVVRFLLDPATEMRLLAPELARIEDQMEDAFWRSRITHGWGR